MAKATALAGLWVAAAWLLVAAQQAAAEPVQTPHVEAELISEVKTIQPGTPFWVGLRLVMDAGWHTYWRNPGDAGLPTEVAWELAQGFTASEIHWPYPRRIEAPPYVSYGYDGEVVLLTEITPPSSLPSGRIVTVTGDASWAVCREDRCLPSGALLSVSLKTDSGKPAAERYVRDYFEQARSALPRRAEGWEVRASADEASVVLTLSPRTGRVEPGRISVFEIDKGVVDHGERAQSLVRDGVVHVRLKAAKPGGAPKNSLAAVLVASAGWDRGGHVKALRISVDIERGGGHPERARRHGLAFTAGVLATNVHQ